MNNHERILMNYIAKDDIKNARKFVLSICENNKTASNTSFCSDIEAQIKRLTNVFELPPNVQNLLYLEDTSVSYYPDRYYVSEREEALIQKILSVHSASEHLRAAGINYLNATLLHGVSGTGKTEFGRHLAYKLGLPFIYFNLSTTVDSLMGGTSKNLKLVFDYVARTECVFMIDEIDAISTNRMSGESSGASKEMARATISLMQNLDQLKNGIIVLAATNMPDLVDPAVWRRFTLHHEVQVFTSHELEEMAVLYLQDVARMSDFPVDYDREDLRRFCDSGIKQSEVINVLIQAMAESIETAEPMHFKRS